MRRKSIQAYFLDNPQQLTRLQTLVRVPESLPYQPLVDGMRERRNRGSDNYPADDNDVPDVCGRDASIPVSHRNAMRSGDNSFAGAFPKNQSVTKTAEVEITATSES